MGRPGARAGRTAEPAAATAPSGGRSRFVWVIHWLLVQIPATYALRFGTPNSPSPLRRDAAAPTGLAHWIVEPLRNWDGLWYRLIALEGYAGGTQSAKAAFWPLLPGIMRGGSILTGWTVDSVGYLVANLTFSVR